MKNYAKAWGSRIRKGQIRYDFKAFRRIINPCLQFTLLIVEFAVLALRELSRAEAFGKALQRGGPIFSSFGIFL